MAGTELVRRSFGRPPALTPRAWTWAGIAGAAALLGVVLGNPDALRIGLGLLFALLALYVESLRLAIAVWRRQVGVRWLVPDHGLRVGESMDTTIVVGNRGPLVLPRIEIDPVAGQALVLTAKKRGHNPGGAESHFAVAVHARVFGPAHFHGVFLRLRDRMRLFVVECYFPLPHTVQVGPRLGTPPDVGRLRTSDAKQRHARVPQRRARSGDEQPEVRQIRDWVPGDPFRRIAWRASARAGRLLVRELERAPTGSLELIVDVGPTMRQGAIGERRLDRALTRALGLARAAISDGYYVGLTLFDLAPLVRVRPGRGPAHERLLRDAIVNGGAPTELRQLGVTESELVTLVARYLSIQYGIDLRVPAPPLADARWAQLVASPAGDLYDLGEVERTLGERVGFRGAPSRSPAERLLAFCAERGLELPWRAPGRNVEWSGGLERLLGTFADGVAVLLLSDLEELAPATVHGLSGRLRRRRVRLSVLHVEAVARPGGLARRIIGIEQRAREQRLRRRGEAAGLRVRRLRATSHIDDPAVVQ